MKNETLSQAVRRLSKEIEQNPGNSKLYFERGMAYFRHENWFNAEDDFSQAIELNPDNDDYLLRRGMSYFNQKNWDAAIADFQELLPRKQGSNYEEAKERKEEYSYVLSWLSKACEQKQAIQSVEERMAPYIQIIEKLKEKVSEQRRDGRFSSLRKEEKYADLLAAMAYFEEYELMEHFFEIDSESDAYLMLNTHISPQLAYWRPTPLYFITSKKVRDKMNNLDKMLRFLASKGANVNVLAGDNSTAVWNQTCTNGSPEILETLLELGGDPNQISVNDEFECAPLSNCLLPDADEEDENKWRPFDDLSIKKAEILLKYGADPNLACPSIIDCPPLIQVIIWGFPQERNDEPLSPKALALIELLLKQGANPNFVDSEGNTPISHAVDNNLLEVGQLLLLYGAKMPEDSEGNTPNEEERPVLEATEDCFFRPGGGSAWDKSFSFPIEDILSSENNQLQTDYYKILITERSENSLTGRVLFDFNGLQLNSGNFFLTEENPIFYTEYQNVAYDTHMRLRLELDMKKEKREYGYEYLNDYEKEFLLALPKDVIEDYYRFAFNTRLGSEFLRGDSGESLYGLIYYFGVLMIPFKSIIYPREKFYEVISKIENLDFSSDPEEEMLEDPQSRAYIYHKYLNWVIAILRSSEEQPPFHSSDIYEALYQLEQLFRQNACHYGDVDFLAVCACLYLSSDFECDFDWEKGEKHLQEAFHIYSNLLQRDDLFDEGQRLILLSLHNLMLKLKDEYGQQAEEEDYEDLNAAIAQRWDKMGEKYKTLPDLSEQNPIVKWLNSLTEKGSAMIVEPNTGEDLILCDIDLSDQDFPEIPCEYADFLKICGGFAFDSLELYGTDIVSDPETGFELTDIVSATEDFNEYYVEEGYLEINHPLLCFGRWNGDYFTYDSQTGKYQVRSHECISDIWDEYDSFIAFFAKEVDRW